MTRKQFKVITAFILVFVLFFGSHTVMATQEPHKNFTLNEADIHKPIFVVTLKDDKTRTPESARAIYRIFFGGEDGVEEEGFPVLNFWTDDKGSKRVQY